MKGLFLIILLSMFAFTANAQRIDTTIYSVCVPPNYPKDGPHIGYKQNSMPPADECPQFPGGDRHIFKFFSKHIKIPKGAKALKVSIFISFIIEKNGKASHLKIVHCTDKDKYTDQFENEAIHLISILPPWKPGRVKGRPVRVEFILPVHFPNPMYFKS